MRKTLYFYVICIVMATAVGCGGGIKNGIKRVSHLYDSLYTEGQAMAVYAYQPVRALQIVDSAVIVGNLSEARADLNRARIYSQSRMKEQLDSLLGGRKDIRLDTARALGERLLRSDSVKRNIKLQQDVLEILVYTARQQDDTLQAFQWLRKLADVCRRQGAETEALRTEAELAALLYFMGQQETGLSRLDSIIDTLSVIRPFRFNELDATIIALKRKQMVLIKEHRNTEMIPVARRIIELLNDYEQHPADYHDGTYREPSDSTDRDDYIRFYRSQAQNFITAAVAVLGEKDSTEAILLQLEGTVREATAREHIARYHAMEKQWEREQQAARAQRFQILACAGCLLALLTVIFARYAVVQRRKENRKNRALVKQISETIDYKQKYDALEKLMRGKADVEPDQIPAEVLEGKNADELFDIIRHRIVEDKLFLDPMFDRQAAAERFGVSVRRIGVAFGQGSTYKSISDFIRECRLEHACQLLRTTNMTISEVVAASGFSRTTTFNHDFKARYELSPTDFRNQLKEK